MSFKRTEEAENKVDERDDIREEMEMVIGPNANWQEYLIAAPKAIAILGELMLDSTAADFNLEKKPPKGGFLRIRCPNSYRASLAQVSHAGWVAFNEARIIMDQIRLYTANVPSHLKEAVTILTKGTVDEVRDLLPTPMKAMNETAEQCQKLSTTVEERFMFVVELSEELLEACLSVKEIYEKELTGTQALKINEFTAMCKKLVHFFQMMSRYYPHIPLNRFIEYADTIARAKIDSGLDGYSISGLLKDIICQLVSEVCKVANLYNMFSGTYVEVSDAHIMGSVSELEKLIGFYPNTDKYKIHEHKTALYRQCGGPQYALKTLVEEKKREFNRQVESRINKLHTALETAFSASQTERDKAKESPEETLEHIPSNDFDISHFV